MIKRYIAEVGVRESQSEGEEGREREPTEKRERARNSYSSSATHKLQQRTTMNGNITFVRRHDKPTTIIENRAYKH